MGPTHVGAGFPRPNRKRLRLAQYDYAKQGAYFVTVCVFEKMCILGDIVHGQMRENGYGRVIHDIWDRLPERYGNIKLDYCVMMPNHFHGIVMITNTDVGAGSPGPYGSIIAGGETPPLRPTLSRVMGYFKYETTKRINGMRNTPGMKLWQRSFHDRVIRDEREWNDIRQYIEYNPQQWADDAENPALRQRLEALEKR